MTSAAQQLPITNNRATDGPITSSKRSSDYMRVVALVKEIGSKNGFEPIPGDQIGWQRRTGQPPLQRMWAWMVSKTLFKGHWSAYAITKAAEHGGEELHIEHAAAALGMDVSNAYKYWKQGAEMGLWRSGTKQEGRRKMFLRGSVPQPPEDQAKGEETAKEIVCTYNLPPYILMEIKEWAPEKQQQFWRERRIRAEVRNMTLAELVNAGRVIVDQDDDTHLRAWSLEIRRQIHSPKGVPEEDLAARRNRLDHILPQVRELVTTIQQCVELPPDAAEGNGSPHSSSMLSDPNKIKGKTHSAPLDAHSSVRTTSDFVPTSEKALYTTLHKASATTATLLPETTLREEQDSRAGAPLSAPHQRHEGQHRQEGREPNQLPALIPTELTKAERGAVDLLFSEFRQMQKSFPRSDLAQSPFSPKSKADQLLVFRVLRLVGAANVLFFVEYLANKFKGLDRNALGKQPPRSPDHSAGPRSFGLILAWAGDFSRALKEEARAGEQEQRDIRAREIGANHDFIISVRRDPEGYRKVIGDDPKKAIAESLKELTVQCIQALADPDESEQGKKAYRELLSYYGVPLETFPGAGAAAGGKAMK